MGMFDSTFDANGDEWQTKAFGCYLTEWGIGDRMDEEHPFDAYQVEVYGGPEDDADGREGLATIRDGVLVAVLAERDDSLPLVDYYGGSGTAGDPS